MNAGKDEIRTKEFVDLAPKGRGSDIRFSKERSNTHRSRDDLVSDIYQTARNLIRRVSDVDMRFVSISEVCFTKLWMP